MEKKNLIKVVDEGHHYTLQNHEAATEQDVFFIKKEPVAEGSTEIKLVQEGTTNEAVLQMLINRLQVLNEKFPSEYNDTALNHLESALSALYARTADREKRDVEGTHQE